MTTKSAQEDATPHEPVAFGACLVFSILFGIVFVLPCTGYMALGGRGLPADEPTSATTLSPQAQVAFATIKDPEYWGISARTDFRTIENVMGEGHFVWIPQTRWLPQRVERRFCWLVLSESEVFPANGSTSTLSPSLAWYRDAAPEVHQRTGWPQMSPARLWLDPLFPPG